MARSLPQLAALCYRAWRYRLGRDGPQIHRLLNHLHPGMTAVDIGAHKGAYTWWMYQRVGTTGRVVAFEPQPELATTLQNLLPTVHVEQQGLSSTPGVAALHIPGQGTPSPGATFEPDLLQGPTVALANLPLTTLDRYFDQQPVHLIKCDVEGHELDVFQGGAQLLRRCQPLLLFECEARHQRRHTMAEVFALLASFGYEGHFYKDGQWQPVARFQESMQSGPPKGAIYINNFVFAAPPS